MKSLGIIAEFNPFHEGHKYLIDRAVNETGSDVCVAVMSGSFVQRGGYASFDKWERTRHAIDGGVNLVVELPAVYAASSAENFAFGGVKTLEAFGCIDTLAFGSESGDIEELQNVVKVLKDNESALLKEIAAFCREGMTFPKAREKALAAVCPGFNTAILREPNNILAIEYMKVIENLVPFTVKRMGQGHHESASEIRKALARENPAVYEERENRYFDLVRTRILQETSNSLEELSSFGDGLGNRLKSEVRYGSSLEQLTGRIKSKAYTHSGISRLMANIVLGIRPEYRRYPRYIRVLGFDNKGAGFLKEVKSRECNKVPVITNINKEWEKLDEAGCAIMEKDILSTDMLNIIYGNDMYRMSDYVKTPVIETGLDKHSRG